MKSHLHLEVQVGVQGKNHRRLCCAHLQEDVRTTNNSKLHQLVQNHCLFEAFASGMPTSCQLRLFR